MLVTLGKSPPIPVPLFLHIYYAVRLLRDIMVNKNCSHLLIIRLITRLCTKLSLTFLLEPPRAPSFWKPLTLQYFFLTALIIFYHII